MKTILALALATTMILPAASTLAQGIGNAPPPYPTGELEGPLTPEEARRREREWIRHERKVAKLNKIMEKEGQEYSQEKYNKYSGQQVGGILLVGAGAITAFSGVLVLFVNLFDGFWTGHGDDEDEGGSGDRDSEYDQKRKIGLGMVLGGLGGYALGIPFIIKGTIGKSRQKYLKQKDQILNGRGPKFRVNLMANPGDRTGGISVNVRF